MFESQINEAFLTIKEVVTDISILLQNEVKQKVLKDKIPNVHIFLGVDITKYHIAVFKQLAQYNNIHYYLFYPFQKEKNSIDYPKEK